MVILQSRTQVGVNGCLPVCLCEGEKDDLLGGDGMWDALGNWAGPHRLLRASHGDRIGGDAVAMANLQVTIQHPGGGWVNADADSCF